VAEIRKAMKPYQQLIRHWKSEGLTIADGVGEALRVFEVKHGVTFPEEFREYLANVNGMLQIGGQDSDGKGFAFWPLNRIRAVPDECAASKVKVPNFDEVESYFAFADYLQWSWAYAIALGTKRRGAILQFGTHSPRIVADSFAEFVEAYISDAERLYIPQSSSSERK
jgi:hypothetical protein